MALMTAAADTDPTIAKARTFGDKTRPGPCSPANLSPRRTVYRV